MTRAEMEQVRKVLEIPSECSACCSCAGHVRTAMQLLDAELAELANQTREWRAVDVNTGFGTVALDSQMYAQRWAKNNNLHEKIKYTIESRTPAGPWERAE